MIKLAGAAEIVTTPTPATSSVLKKVPYATMWEEQARSRAFNFVMLDKAMIHMSYEFVGNALTRHRLAFLPAPSLIEFQNNPELYIHEVLYGEVVGHQVMAVPIRIDFDVRPGVDVGPKHPPAHLTLGQYKHCRIPVSAPVTPAVFVDFLVRHFYATPELTPISIDTELDAAFAASGEDLYEDVVHMLSPGRRG